MRIAHVIATFPPRIGGMGKVAHDECRRLVERGHEVTVFTLNYGERSVMSDSDEERSPASFGVVRMKPWIRGGDAGWVPSLYFKLKGFDIVHLHYPWYGGAEWALLAKLLRKQKYVVTYHMDAAPQKWYQRVVRAVYDTFLAGSILARAERVIVIDKEHFQDSRFGKMLDPKKVVELANPIDTDLFCPATPVGQGDKKNLLFVGNLLPVKRLDLLLTALALLPSDVVLTVVGGGYAEESLKFLASQLNIFDRVTFVGSLSPEKVAEYYRGALVTIIPSDAESFSLVALESLATGTPVIASDIIGIRGRIVNGVDGFLFAPGSVESLVEKIQKMLQLTTDERRKMGQAGREKVLEKYSLEEHVVSLEKIYMLAMK